MPSEALGLAVVVVGTGLAAVIDLRTRRIPNALTGALAVITSTGSGVQTIFSRISSALTNAVPAP